MAGKWFEIPVVLTQLFTPTFPASQSKGVL